MDLTGAAAQNLISPVILLALLGIFAALLKSSLTIPETPGKRQALERVVALGAAWRGAYEPQNAEFHDCSRGPEDLYTHPRPVTEDRPKQGDDR